MGKYTFTWEHAATEVLVTGTFDSWGKSVTLEKENGVFKKSVELPKVHTQYKFVVDGNWVVNDSARKEDDGNGIVNNVLLPEDIVDEPVHTLSSAAPQSTTAALAGAVPKEKSKSQESIPGAFPETPAAAYETPATEFPSFNIAPIPATDGPGNPIKLAAGEPVPHHSTLTSNTIHSTVKHDEPSEVQTFGVAPLPATAGAGNPIHLAPGEKVPDPSTFTSNTVQSTAKSDPTSYEKSDALFALPDLGLTPQAERDAKGGMFGLPPVMGNMIPESSLPMGVDAKTEQDTGVTIQSAAPTSTTAALAAQVPKEPRGVPETVVDSQKQAGVAPEAAANPLAVLEKREVEQELKETVPEAPAAADNSYASQISSAAGNAATKVSENSGPAAASAAAAVTAGAGLFTAAIFSAKEKAAEAVGVNGSATSGVPSVVTDSQKAAHVGPEASANVEAVHEKGEVEQELLSSLSKTNATGEPAPAIAIPAVVAESQRVAHASPEAAANSEAVAEKKAVESELLKEIPKTNEAGEPAPVFSAATSATAPGAKLDEPAPNVPDVVAESEQAAHASPEAAANTEVVGEKKAVEAELLEAVPKSNATGEPAPVIAATTSEWAGLTAKPAKSTTESSALNAPASAPVEPVTFTPIDSNTNVALAPKEPTTTDSSALNAPASAPAQVPTSKPIDSDTNVAFAPKKPTTTHSSALNAPASAPAQVPTSKPIDSDTNVAFAPKEPTTTEQTKPTVTTGTETISTAPKTEATSSTVLDTPKQDARKDSDVSPKGTPGTQSLASAADDKKKKRRSIFGKIKDKLSSKN